nr:MAG: hypothetical protein [Bacteriophage sp.]
MNDYQDIIDNLPKPTTDLEEQYLYSIVMAMAGKDYQPFTNPFWRKEQYLKAWWEITKLQVAEGNIPNDNSVSTEKIIDGAVTLIKLAKEVVNKLLADDKIETSMIKDLAITTEKIVDKNVTISKLSKEVVNKLLTDDKIETSMIKDLAITTEKIVNNAISAEKVSDDAIILSKLSKEVTNLLLTANHVGIIQQPQINQITESGDMLTLDIIKNKINEIIQLLNNAEITK